MKFIDGPKLDQVFTFKSDEKILIGRMPTCNIKFDDNQLSRLQCTIENIDGNWILKDGDGNKSSTNGTWLFVDELFKIYDGMVFKAGQTLFRTRKLPPGTIQAGSRAWMSDVMDMMWWLMWCEMICLVVTTDNKRFK